MQSQTGHMHTCTKTKMVIIVEFNKSIIIWHGLICVLGSTYWHDNENSHYIGYFRKSFLFELLKAVVYSLINRTHLTLT